jgi:hypothetical protein
MEMRAGAERRRSGAPAPMRHSAAVDPARTPPSDLDAWGLLRESGLSQLSEREGECRDASGEHDESERRDAPRNQPEPSRSESPSQSE